MWLALAVLATTLVDRHQLSGIALMAVRPAKQMVPVLHMAEAVVLVVAEQMVVVPHTRAVQMAITVAGIMLLNPITEKVKGLLHVNLAILTVTCTLAVAAAIIVVAMALAAMVEVQTVDSRHRIIPVAVLAVQLNRLLQVAVPESLLSASIRRRQHEIRNGN